MSTTRDCNLFRKFATYVQDSPVGNAGAPSRLASPLGLNVCHPFVLSLSLCVSPSSQVPVGSAPTDTEPFNVSLVLASVHCFLNVVDYLTAPARHGTRFERKPLFKMPTDADSVADQICRQPNCQ